MDTLCVGTYRWYWLRLIRESTYTSIIGLWKTRNNQLFCSQIGKDVESPEPEHHQR